MTDQTPTPDVAPKPVQVQDASVKAAPTAPQNDGAKTTLREFVTSHPEIQKRPGLANAIRVSVGLGLYDSDVEIEEARLQKALGDLVGG